jgi:hypothetical protein
MVCTYICNEGENNFFGSMDVYLGNGVDIMYGYR